MAVRILSMPALFEEIFGAIGKPYTPSVLVDLDPARRPVKRLDFSSSGAYSVYNWEIFFHVPLLVAIHLSRNGRYEEAQRWFHFVFDPTDNGDGPAPQRFWKVRPFLDAGSADRGDPRQPVHRRGTPPRTCVAGHAQGGDPRGHRRTQGHAVPAAGGRAPPAERPTCSRP